MFRRPTSIRLFNIAGIRVGVDATWFVVLFLVIFLLSGSFRSVLRSSDGVAYVTTVATVLLFFASLIVHELGHALVARRQGIDVNRIELFLFGGLTQMSRDSATPAEELKVAAAGPFATLLFALVCLAVDLAIVGPHRLLKAIQLNGDIRITPVLLSLSWLFLMNVIILVFNLVPAYPLDGGRIARAVVWHATGDKLRGTRAAAKLGQGFAVLLGGAGLWLLVSSGSFYGAWLLVLAYLLYKSAHATLLQSVVTERIEGVRIADIMDHEPVVVPADTPVTDAYDQYFLRYGAPWLPVVDASGHFVGIARRERVDAAAHGPESWLTTGSVLESDEAASLRVDENGRLTDLISRESLGRLGAVMAVDRDGVLRGVVTSDQVRRALSSVLGPPAGLS
jgi:Zn-dependent protease